MYIYDKLGKLNTKTVQNEINWKYIVNKENNEITQIYYVSKSGYTIIISLEFDYFKLEVDEFVFFFHKGDIGYSEMSQIWKTVTSDFRVNHALKYMMFG